MILFPDDLRRAHSSENLYAMVRVLSKTTSGFNICHINAQSLHKKIDEFRFVFEGSEMDIICVSETWFRTNISDNNYNLRGYRLFRSDRILHAGGVAIYVKSSISCRTIESDFLLINDENNESAADVNETLNAGTHRVEFLFLELFSSSQKLLLGTFYRPNNSINMKPLIDKLSLVTCGYTDIVLIGDFNSNIRLDRGLLDDMYTIGMHIVNDAIPTHYSSSTSTLIDLCFANNLDRILLYDQLSASAFSRHDLIFISYDFQIKKQAQVIQFRDYKNIDLRSLEMELRDIPWNQTFLMPTVDEQVNFLHGNIQYLFEKYVPVKTKTISYEKPWFTSEIKALIEERNNAYYRWKRFKTSEMYNVFKISRNKVNRKIRMVKTRFYTEKFQSAMSSKRKWKEISSMGVINSRILPNNEIDVNQLCLDFSNFTTIDADLEYYNSVDSFRTSSCSRFEFKNVTQDDVVKIILSIKSNSIGSDEIHPKFLKIILPHIVGNITHLANMILTTSSFPTMWKCAKIIPVPKQDKNFRPIALMPYLSKIVEKLMYVQMSDYLYKNGVFSERQSGFRPNHSCISALIDVSEELRSKADENMISFLVLLDHSKAFDSVDHTVLCQKLRHMCHFSETAVKLITSYLKNRSQFVYFGSKKSNSCAITRGVPQGSILGPLLYSVYSNDLPTKLKFCNVQMYADDVQLYISCFPSDITNCIENLNSDLQNVFRWATLNGLCLNPRKSKALIIGKVNESPPIKIDNSTVCVVQSSKNLGVIFNNSLSWTNHINTVCGKTFVLLRNLWLTQYFTPFHIRLLLAKTYLIPTLLYGCELFSSCDSASKNKLKVMFNNIARYVYGRRRYSRISDFSYRIYNISFENLLKCRILLYLHKVIYTKQPSYLYNRLTFSRSYRGKKINCIRYRKLISDRHFFVNAIRLWNELSNDIQLLSNAKQFRTAIFAFF